MEHHMQSDIYDIGKNKDKASPPINASAPEEHCGEPGNADKKWPVEVQYERIHTDRSE